MGAGRKIYRADLQEPDDFDGQDAVYLILRSL
jgi:hypothetical protein